MLYFRLIENFLQLLVFMSKFGWTWVSGGKAEGGCSRKVL
jgi:hypothetical protein